MSRRIETVFSHKAPEIENDETTRTKTLTQPQMKGIHVVMYHPPAM